MWLNEKEGSIISELYSSISEIWNSNRKNRNYSLYFANGEQIIAEFITCYESCNCHLYSEEDEEWEEYYEFNFKILKIEKKSKESILRKNKEIVLNYHNWPTKWELTETD